MSHTITVTLVSKPSNSKGWGRYSLSSDGGAVVKSSTGNEWVSASHKGDANEGATLVLRCQVMNRVGKRKDEVIETEEFTLVAEAGASVTIDSRPEGIAQGMTVRVEGARLAEVG